MGHKTPKAVLMLVAVGTLIAPLSPAAPGALAVGPQMLEVVAGAELEVEGSDGKRVSAVSLRFLPEEIKVHSGDTLRFTSEVPLASVALLPETVAGACHSWSTDAAADCAPRRWLEEQAFGLDHPWYPVEPDLDDRWAKVNNAAAFPPFPACGHGPSELSTSRTGPLATTPEQRPCTFPLSAEEADLQSTRWGFARRPAPVPGVLSSGLADPLGPKTLDFRVTIDASPGTVLWVVQLFAREAHLRIEVVGEDGQSSTQADVDAARTALLAADTRLARRLDARFAAKNEVSVEDGIRTWEAYLGVEEGPVALRQAYPKVLTIQKGDRVRWRSDYVKSLAHTVTLPGDDVTIDPPPFFTTECDLDGDEPAEAIALPDVASSVSGPVFCPGGWQQVEFDLSPLVGSGDTGGEYHGAETPLHSGVRGAVPDVDLPQLGIRIDADAPYVVDFPVTSPPEGFTYACALHGSLNREMSGAVVVR